MIYLIRHGQTAFNAEGRYQGQCDSPLTDVGRQQAVALAGVLSPLVSRHDYRLVASPLGRSLATATLMAQQLGFAGKVEQDARLMEVGMGAWDGLTRAEISARWPDHRKVRGALEWMFDGPGGERYETLSARLQAALADLTSRPEASVIVVSHAVAGRVLRGLHAGLGRAEALAQDAPQDVIFALSPGGRIDRLEPSAA